MLKTGTKPAEMYYTLLYQQQFFSMSEPNCIHDADVRLTDIARARWHQSRSDFETRTPA